LEFDPGPQFLAGGLLWSLMPPGGRLSFEDTESIRERSLSDPPFPGEKPYLKYHNNPFGTLPFCLFLKITCSLVDVLLANKRSFEPLFAGTLFKRVGLKDTVKIAV
jgi:hypothetical protein